uniref:BTB domain-containing protein n=1 Tax=Ditylenchus dipsaci TaxID=166011 RepID=A0A915CTR7_9BILA
MSPSNKTCTQKTGSTHSRGSPKISSSRIRSEKGSGKNKDSENRLKRLETNVKSFSRKLGAIESSIQKIAEKITENVVITHKSATLGRLRAKFNMNYVNESFIRSKDISVAGAKCDVPDFAQFLSSTTLKSDCTLVVEGYRIPISKALLATYSVYFDTLFYGRFAESNKDEVELKEVSAAEFIPLLEAIYPSNNPEAVIGANMECLLRMANRYMVDNVTQRCAYYLIKHPGDVVEKLVFAQQYNLTGLMVCFQVINQREHERGDLTTQPLEGADRTPTCRYEVLSGGINGQPVRFANIGDQLIHKWTCDSEGMGMLVHSCFVRDGVGSEFALLDDRGCVTDISLLQPLTYTASLNSSYTPISAFKFADQMIVYFSCQITLCNKRDNGCEGITNNNLILWLSTPVNELAVGPEGSYSNLAASSMYFGHSWFFEA